MAKNFTYQRRHKDIKLPKESNHAEDEDWIRKLPDAVLSEILSNIRPKHAAKTCILSTRWRNLWALSPILKFVMPSCKNHTEVKNYMDFVFRIMDLRNGLQIQKFRFHCLENCDYDRVYTLICTILKCDVQFLNLHFLGEREKGIKLPPVLFMNYASLVHLRLSEYVLLDVPASVCIPNLKILQLLLVTYSDEAAISNLVSGCPVLEELFVKRCLGEMGDNITTFSISTSSLKQLHLVFSFEKGNHECFGDVCKYKTVIDAPNLERLSINDHISAYYLINSSLPLLVEAFVDVETICGIPWNYGDRLLGLLRSVSAVEFLIVSGFTLTALVFADVRDPPFFNTLVELWLGIDDIYGWRLLPSFLEKVPNLEALAFPEGLVNLGYPGDTSQFSWDLPEDVPDCLVFKIKKIKINNFYGKTKKELKFIKYLLKNAKVLTHMEINSFAGFDPIIQNKLLKFRKGSSFCQLHISWGHGSHRYQMQPLVTHSGS